jgi:hypothetical protein
VRSKIPASESMAKIQKLIEGATNSVKYMRDKEVLTAQ